MLQTQIQRCRLAPPLAEFEKSDLQISAVSEYAFFGLVGGSIRNNQYDHAVTRIIQAVEIAQFVINHARFVMHGDN